MKYSFLKINGALFSVALLLSTPGVQANFAAQIAAAFSTSKKRMVSFFDTKNTESCQKHLQYLQQALDNFSEIQQEVDLQKEMSESAREHIKKMVGEAKSKFADLLATIKSNLSSHLFLGQQLNSKFGSSKEMLQKIGQDLEKLSDMLVQEGKPAPALDIIAAEIKQDCQKTSPTLMETLQQLKHRLNCR